MALLVDQFLEVVHSRQREARKTQHEQDCVHYVRFTRTVQTCNRVELFVEIGYYCTLWVRFETIYYQFFYVHF
jgi:glutamyl-tRNA reductase